jgi:putative flippase GtrA
MIKKKMMVFLIVGVMTVMVDYVVYRGLALSGLWDISVCKALGFMVGSVFAFVVNRFWTFGDRNHSAGSWVRFCTLYSLTLFINIYINDSMLDLTTDFHFSIQVAFLLATGVSAVLNFLGMNYFVFGAERYQRTT